jgi:hypothetical protein
MIATYYSVIADPHPRIVETDDVMDVSTLIATGTAHEMERVMRDIYEEKVAAFEEAYEAHIEDMWPEPLDGQLYGTDTVVDLPDGWEHEETYDERKDVF